MDHISSTRTPVDLDQTLIQGANRFRQAIASSVHTALGFLPIVYDKALHRWIRKRGFDLLQVRWLNSLPPARATDEAVDLPTESVGPEEQFYILRECDIGPDSIDGVFTTYGSTRHGRRHHAYCPVPNIDLRVEHVAGLSKEELSLESCGIGVSGLHLTIEVEGDQDQV